MTQKTAKSVDRLLRAGARIPDPSQVYVGPEVDVSRIDPRGLVLHPGVRITGADTLIMENTELGREGPSVVHNCLLGSGVRLKGGSFDGAVFLARASAGPAAHVRPGTILEEEAGIAHATGLKQTILFPFATLGSLINFCDILMAGGTSRKNHSEVGSSYIHFNFTPNGDKATASLLGDVPRGVMLDQPPIFLGGQGGLVGPCCIAFGTVIAAGTVWRKDVKIPGNLVSAKPAPGVSMPFAPGVYRAPGRVVKNNLRYMANLKALLAWYQMVRARFAEGPLGEGLQQGLVNTCKGALAERARRMDQVAGNMPASLEKLFQNSDTPPSESLVRQKEELAARWSEARDALISLESPPDEAFLESVDQRIREMGKDYLAVIQSLSPKEKAAGTKWLDRVARDAEQTALAVLPSFA